jgi:MFS family permease
MSETIKKKPEKITMIMVGVMISLFLASLDETITGTAMPKIINNLNGIALYNWPFTMYMLCSTIAIPIIGRIADLYGHKFTYIIGIVVFLCSSMLCGFANNMTQFIIFRGIQGIGGGILIANSFIVVGDLFAPVERAKYMGLVASMFGLASIIHRPGAGRNDYRYARVALDFLYEYSGGNDCNDHHYHYFTGC